MDALIHTFMTQMYWIDISAICAITLLCGIRIGVFQSRTIVKNNKEYNQELTRLRKEIYNECEKNFFL
jgi:uncharacterized protein YneF (UPF0154 family)